jgi:hypothetical protein
LTATGAGTAEEHREPAGRGDDEQRQGVRVPLIRDRVRHPEQAWHGGGDHRIADDVESVVLDAGRPPEVREEQDLRDRRDEQDDHEQVRVQPTEQRAVAQEPAYREHAESPRHVSASVARRRAERRNTRSSNAPSAP